MKIKNFLSFSALFILINVLCNAQSSFHYDSNGNRDSRTIGLKSTNSGSEKQPTVIDTSYFDSLGDIKISIFPNPTEGEIEINIENLETNVTSHIMVYDFSGKLLKTQNNLNETNLLNLSEFSNGTYIVRIMIDSHISEWKIIKE